MRVSAICLTAAISVIVVNEMVPDVAIFALVVVSVVVRLDDSVIGHGIDDWGSKVQSARHDCVVEVQLHLVESLFGFLIVWQRLHEVLHNDGTLVDCDNLDLRAVHAEHSRHPVHEVVNAVCRVEFFQGPVETHTDHNSVLGDDSDLAIWHNEELKEVLDTDISILSATRRSGQLTVSARILVPLSVRHIDAIRLDSVRSSVGIWDLDFDATNVSLELESEVVCGRAREVQRVVAEGLDLNRESREALLSGVEAVPHVVHHAVHLVHVASQWV